MINDLENLFLKSREEYTAENVSSVSFGHFISDFAVLWKDILDYIKNYHTSPHLNNDFTYNSENDNDRKDSLFGYLSKQIDLNNSLFNSLIDKIKGNIDLLSPTGVSSNDYFWNESMNYCIAYVLKQLDAKNNLQEIISGGARNFYLDELKNADAAESFEEKGEWVSPWKNIDNNTYSYVRTVLDNVLSVLTNSKNLDFTAEDNNDWIRLLMPKNIRRVEVEDLNRNFWTTGQVTTIISAYLFGSDSPITNSFKNLLNEIVQCWQNILYLYGLYAILLQGYYYTDVHTEVLYLPSSTLQPYKKYDNFDDNSDIIEKVKYIAKRYPTSNLCILPCCRRDNYKHNYYKVEEYPCIVFYDRNKDKWTQIELQFASGKPVRFSFDQEDSGIDYSIKVYGVREDEDNGYRYMSPLSNLENLFDLEERFYYGTLRIIPTISANYLDGTIIVDQLGFKVEDAARRTITKTDTTLAIYTKGEGVWDSNSDNGIGKINQEEKRTLINENDFSQIRDQITNSLYLGEVVTTAEISKKENRANYTFTRYDITSQAKLLFVGGYMPPNVLNQHPGTRVGLYTDPNGAITSIYSYYTPYFPAGAYYKDTYFEKEQYNWEFYHNNNFGNKVLSNQSVGAAYTRVSSVDSNDLKNRFYNYIIQQLNQEGILEKSGIQYFLTEYGADCPWVGGTDNPPDMKARMAATALGDSNAQYSGLMYWVQRVLAHLFRFIPYGTALSSNGTPVYDYNGVRLGTVEDYDIGVVDEAYSWAHFLNKPGYTTWRVPSLYYGEPDKKGFYYYYLKTDIATGNTTSGYITQSTYAEAFAREKQSQGSNLTKASLLTQEYIEANTVKDTSEIYGDRTFRANLMIEDYNDTFIGGQYRKNNLFNSNGHTERVWITITEQPGQSIEINPKAYQTVNGEWNTSVGSIGKYTTIGAKTNGSR